MRASDSNRLLGKPVNNWTYPLFLLKARIEAVGGEPMRGIPEEARAFIRAEIPRWAQAVKASGVKLN